ncbi:uncharacterized protein At5g39865 [Impatiens glandulifera]|uniref:uncharacterized protein At5g39865 n=1 Tax=Impatiens glandulifera TaxID=253017 RepID=UPI001FB19783|nr:uncharacterized protein At5g39865 [Impatiens glandulifera]
MWLQKKKSTPPKDSNFHCSSFKDIHRLFPSAAAADSNPPHPQLHHHHHNSTASIFHRVRLAQSILRAWAPRPSLPPPPDSNNDKTSEPLISLPGSEKRIIVYYTSLRVVRTTFDDCKDVLSILRGFRVSIDERDLAMDSKFMDELKGILKRKSSISLPRIFIEGRYIGGADEIRHLNEAGELKKCLQAIPPAVGGVCESCGGFRFILCDECSGSRKIFSDKTGFRSCTACNENGLMRHAKLNVYMHIDE